MARGNEWRQCGDGDERYLLAALRADEQVGWLQIGCEAG